MITSNERQTSTRVPVAVVTGDAARLGHLRDALSTDARLRVVPGDGTPASAVDGLATAHEPGAAGGVVVLDIPSHLGDEIALVRSITAATHDPAVVVVGPEHDLALDALMAGASGVVARDASPPELCEAVVCVAGGEATVPTEVTTTLVRRYQLLTSR